MMNAEFEMTEDESIQFEKDYERFSIIQDENNFKTEWCLYEIENVNEDYYTQSINWIESEKNKTKFFK